MATIEVSTWAELVNAIKTAGNGDIVQLTTDIDCNREIPEGVTTTIKRPSSGLVYNLTITGAYTEDGVTKNHVIRNLRTNISSPVSIFYFMYNYGDAIYVNFRNIDFINLILDAPLVELYYYLNAYLRFYSCRFVGKRTHALIYHTHKPTSSSDAAYIQFYSCFINMEYTRSSNDRLPIVLYQSGSSYDYCTANYCRIKQEYKGWTIGTATNPYDAIQNITFGLQLNGCYLYGTFVGTGNDTSAVLNVTNKYSYNGAMQNVVDADFRLGGTPTSGMDCTIVAPKGIFVNSIHKLDEDPPTTTYNAVNYNSSGNSKAIPINPEDMTDAQALYDAGFDIIVPESA